MQKVRKIENTQASLLYVWYMYQYSYLVKQVEVLLSQFEWYSRDSPTETWLMDCYRSLSFVTPANFPHAVTVRRMANDVTYRMYAALPIHLRVQSMVRERYLTSDLWKLTEVVSTEVETMGDESLWTTPTSCDIIVSTGSRLRWGW